MNEPIVNVEKVTKSFLTDAEPVHVLKEITFSINAGEMIALAGMSGAGKTTLLQILGGLESCSQGIVTIQGANITGMQRRELAIYRSKSIGFVFQFHHLLPDFTALENVMIPGMIFKAATNSCKSRALELIDMMGLSHRKTHFPSELSGGERQRFALARALMNKPALILADEPTGNLDSGNTHKLIELFKTANRDFGQTFLIATHNETLAKQMDRTILIHDGKIVDNR